MIKKKLALTTLFSQRGVFREENMFKNPSYAYLHIHDKNPLALVESIVLTK